MKRFERKDIFKDVDNVNETVSEKELEVPDLAVSKKLAREVIRRRVDEKIEEKRLKREVRCLPL